MERFKDIFNDHGAVMLIIDAGNGAIFYANPAAEKFYGWSVEKLQTMKIQDINILPQEEIFAEMEKASREGRRFFEFRHRLVDGSIRDVEVFSSRFRLEGREYLHSIIHDMTERTEATEALRESEEKFRRIVESSPVAQYFYHLEEDERLVLVGANPAADRIIGISHKSLIGKTIEEAFPLLAQTEVPDMYRAVARGELGSQSFEIPYSDKRFTGFYEVEVFQTGARGIAVDFTDISERKRTEANLQTMQKLESLGVLAGGIAHDFNNLLTGIYGYIDLASMEPRLETIREYLARTSATIERARALTQQLLTFAKGGGPIQKVQPLFPFVRETVEFALSGSNVSCDYEIENGLWDCNFDRNQIAQVMENLIINAQQAMPLGGKVWVEAKNSPVSKKGASLLEKGDYVRISVRDQGIGIPLELQGRIFDPFFTTKEKGHGLGLAISYSIISKHGGCLELESAPGKGSVFHIYLPAAHELPESTQGLRSSEGHYGQGTVLVMDDEEVIRESLRGMLSAMGYDVVCVKNGQEAVAYIEEALKTDQLPVFLLFDLTIPGGMGAKEALEKIRLLCAAIPGHPNLPAFVSSGYAEDPVMRNPADYGFRVSLPKPFRRQELMELLQKQLGTLGS